MQPLRSLSLPLALTAAFLCAAHDSAAQGAADIPFDAPQTFQFQVRVAVSPGTERVFCYQEDQFRVVGTSAAVSGSTTSVLITLPELSVRCAACNSWGCSSLSPNAAVVVAADPLDFDLNTLVDVRDMVMCYARIRDRIY